MNWSMLARRPLNEEIEQHLDDRYDELLARGLSAAEAQQAVLAEIERRRSDDMVLPVEPSRSEPIALGVGAGPHRFAGFGQDLRYGARLIGKDAAAAAVIVLTLALAIAANAIVFGFADLLLFRPLPIANAPRIAAVFSQDARQTRNRQRLSIPEFLDVKAGATAFEDVAAATQQAMSLTGAGEPRAVTANFVTPNLHQMWRLDAVAGRPLQPGDGQGDNQGVAVVSHRFWSAFLGGERSIVGRSIALNGTRYTIVGVLTPAIELGNLASIDVWLPLDTTRPARRDDRILATFALLAPGATVDRASAELAAIGERLGRQYPLTDSGRRLFALSLRDSIAGGDTWMILLLLGVIVALVLVVACANVATVMLARASARRREIAVRIALGASRARLIRQLGLEGLLLGLLSGALGLLVTGVGLALFKAYSPETFFQRLIINGNMLAFTLALSVIAPILFGVLPALQMSRPDLNEDLKDGGRDALSSARGNRSRAALVVAQVGFALTVLIVSGLIVRTVVAMKYAPLGFSPAGVLTVRVRLDPPKYRDDAARLRMIESTLERLGQLPGVAAVGAMAAIPLVDGEPARRFTIAGRPSPSPSEMPWAVEALTLGDYAPALEIRIVEGRLWRPDDRATSWAVAAVNREAARRYWPGRSPVGERVSLVDGADGASAEPIEIVGVVDDVVGTDVDEPPPPRVYRPLASRPASNVAFAVRVTGDAAAAASMVREALRRADRDLAISDVRTLAVDIRTALRQTELIVVLFAIFAAIGLIVAVAGIYGITAFSVGQRRHEIGVRLALGATGSDVVRLVVFRTIRLVTLGSVFGVAAGWALAQAMKSMLTNNVGAADPLTYSTVIALLAVSALAASYVPAHRVWTIDPASVLKRE